MSAPRFVRFFPSDWRSGCLGLNFEQQGLYIAICAHYWETAERLPLDDAFAARRLGVNCKNYRRVRDQLLQLGKIQRYDDGYSNHRAELEFEAARRAIKADQKVGLDTAREAPDCEHADGRDQVQKRRARQDTIDRSIVDQSVDQSSIHRSIDAEKSKQNQGPFIEPYKDSISKVSNPLTPKGADRAQCLEAFTAYNDQALVLGLPQASRLTPARERAIGARLREYGLDGWKVAIGNLAKSKFLCGETSNGFRADLDFVCQAKSFSRLHDGGYGQDRVARCAVVSPEQKRKQSDDLAQMYLEMGRADEQRQLRERAERDARLAAERAERPVSGHVPRMLTPEEKAQSAKALFGGAD